MKGDHCSRSFNRQVAWVSWSPEHDSRMKFQSVCQRIAIVGYTRKYVWRFGTLSMEESMSPVWQHVRSDDTVQHAGMIGGCHWLDHACSLVFLFPGSSASLFAHQKENLQEDKWTLRENPWSWKCCDDPHTRCSHFFICPAFTSLMMKHEMYMTESTTPLRLQSQPYGIVRGWSDFATKRWSASKKWILLYHRAALLELDSFKLEGLNLGSCLWFDCKLKQLLFLVSWWWVYMVTPMLRSFLELP